MISDDDTYEFVMPKELIDDSYVNLCNLCQSPPPPTPESSPSPSPYNTDSRISFLENLLMSKAKTICKNKYTKSEYIEALEILAELREDPFKNKNYKFVMDKYNDMVFDNCYHRILFLQQELSERGVKNINKTKQKNLLIQLYELEEIAENYDASIK